MEENNAQQPLRLKLVRRYNRTDYCIGRLYIDGKYFCDTMEPRDMSDEEMEGNAYSPHACPATPEGAKTVNWIENILWIGRNDFCGTPIVDAVHKEKYMSWISHEFSFYSHGSNSIPWAMEQYYENWILVGFNTKKGQLTDDERVWNILTEQYVKPAVKAGREITIEIARTYEL